MSISAKVSAEEKKEVERRAAQLGISQTELVITGAFGTLSKTTPVTESARAHLACCHALRRIASAGGDIDRNRLDELLALTRELIAEARREREA